MIWSPSVIGGPRPPTVEPVGSFPYKGSDDFRNDLSRVDF